MTKKRAEKLQRRSKFGRATYGLNSLGTLGILAMVVFVNIDVLGRVIFNKPIPGVTEFVGLAIVAVVWLQAADTLRNQRFIRSDMVHGRIVRRFPIFGGILDAFFDLVGLMICGVILTYNIPMTIQAYVHGYYSGTFGVFTIPIWPVKFLVLVGCAALLVQFLVSLVAKINKIRYLRDSAK